MSIEGLETPERIGATLMRLGLLGLNRGFYTLPAAIRRMPEAEQARQAIYAADFAIRGGLDPAELAEMLAAFGEGVRPFAERGYDPWNLYLRAVDPAYRKFCRVGDRRAAAIAPRGQAMMAADDPITIDIRVELWSLMLAALYLGVLKRVPARLRVAREFVRLRDALDKSYQDFCLDDSEQPNAQSLAELNSAFNSVFQRYDVSPSDLLSGRDDDDWPR